MSLWGSQYASGIKDLLRGLDEDNLKALANTACNNRLRGVDSKGHVEIILRCTDSLEKLFTYQRITSQLLRDYLYKRNQTICAEDSRRKMIDSVKNMWEARGSQVVISMSLWDSPEASKIKELLKGLDDATLKSLANTASTYHVTGRTANDNVEVILRWTEKLEKLLFNKKITTQDLRDYLYKKKQPITATEKKRVLVERVQAMWFGLSGPGICHPESSGAAAVPWELMWTPPDSSLSPQCPTPADIRQDHAEQSDNGSAGQDVKDECKEELTDAREAERLNKSRIEDYILMAKCKIALGDPSAALSVLCEATDLDQGNRAAKDEIVRAHGLIVCQEEIEKAFSKEDYSTAMGHLDQALGLAEGCQALEIKKAECLVMLQKYTEAKEMIKEIIQVDDRNPDAIYVEGMCLYYSEDDMEEAMNRFQRVLRLAPDHTKARELYKKVKELKQKKEEGNAAFGKGLDRKAIAVYTEALTIDPHNRLTNAKLYRNRATVTAKFRNWRAAMEDCTAAIKLDGCYLKAYLQRARCYQELGRHEEAVRDYEMVVLLDNKEKYKTLLQGAKTQLISDRYSNRSVTVKREREEHDFFTDAKKRAKFD